MKFGTDDEIFYSESSGKENLSETPNCGMCAQWRYRGGKESG